MLSTFHRNHQLRGTEPYGNSACRSLMAAYELASTGYQKLSILQGGFYEWEKSGRWGTARLVSCPVNLQVF